MNSKRCEVPQLKTGGLRDLVFGKGDRRTLTVVKISTRTIKILQVGEVGLNFALQFAICVSKLAGCFEGCMSIPWKVF